MASDPDNQRPTVWAPSPRVTAALAVAMLATGVGIGAAIGPAPEASFGGSARLGGLLGSLSARTAAAEAAAAKASTTSSLPAAITATASPAVRHHRKHRRKRVQAASGSGTSEEATSASETSSSPGSKAKHKSAPSKTVTLPPISKVWLIELTGSTFSEALAAPAASSFITSHAVPAGALLSGWSSLQAAVFADDAALIATTGPRLAETILQPPCPEGAAGAPCAAGTPGAQKTADEFLALTLPAITSTAAYRTSGLIVITFGSTAAGTASGLPSGSTTATLSSVPPAGALLLSPFVTAGKRPATTFNPSSPRQSLEALLHR